MNTAVVALVARLVTLLLDYLEKWDRSRAEEARQRIRDEADKDPAGSFAAHFGHRLRVSKDAPDAAEADTDGNGKR